MKKTLIAVVAIAMFVAVFGAVGTAYAMDDAGNGPGNGGVGNGAAGENGTDILSTYMVDAVASTLGLDPVVVADRLSAGETFYDIAISEGYTEEFVPVLLESIKETALEAAAADGLSPQAQDQLNTQLSTNLGIQSQLQDGTCDGTGDCLLNDPIPNLYLGTSEGMHGHRGGR